MRHNALFTLPHLLGALALAASHAANAQSYPVKPIRWIVPYATGSFDTVTRALAPQMSAGLGQPLVVENRPASSGVVGMEIGARAAPDGYTIVTCGLAQLVIQKFVNSKLPYDVDRDFAPISLFAKAPMVLFVHESVPAATLAELLAYARANPGKLNYGSSGIGSVFHLTTELFKQRTATQLVHIPYKGGGPMVVDLIAGRVHVAFYPPTGQLTSLAKTNKVRALALAADTRMATIPAVPTFEEAGVANFDVVGWIAAVAPVGVPRAIVERLHREISKAVAAPEVTRIYEQASLVTAASSPEELTQTVRRDQNTWGPLIKKLDIREE